MRNKMSVHCFNVRAGLLFCGLCVFNVVSLAEPQGAANVPAVNSSVSQQAVYVVFPFANAGASPRLDWLGEGLEELTIEYISASGQQVYTHAARTAELERNGMPPSAK